MRAALALASTLLAMPAVAQTRAPASAPAPDKVWTPAPTAGPLSDNMPPSDRAGVATSADIGAPFSSTPSGATAGSGRGGTPTVGTTPSDETVTPNLSK